MSVNSIRVIEFIMCILLASSLVLETSGNLEKGYFSVDVGVGLKENGDTSFSFPMLIDISSSASMVPDVSCSTCKLSNRYNSSQSIMYDPISCSSDMCAVSSRDICPTSISEQGKCCDIHHQGLCLYDSTIQFNTVFPASGGIISDSVRLMNITTQAYFATIFNSTFSSLPSNIVGILGLSEESCNPTCVPPIYHSILQKEDPQYSKQDMKVGICFGKTKGKVTFGNEPLSIAATTPIIAYQREKEVGYTFDLQDLLLNNRSYTGFTALGLNRAVVLESTFTEIRLPQDLYDIFVREMRSSFSHLEGVKDGRIFDEKGINSLEGYPSFDIKIPGALLHLPPELYFLKKRVVGIEQYFLDIKPNHFQNTVQLGLSALRGFAIQFQYEQVTFASVNATMCGDDMDNLVGTVEWASKKDDTDLDHPVVIVLIVFCVLCVFLVLILIKGQSKKQLPISQPNYQPTPEESFRDTQQNLIDTSV